MALNLMFLGGGFVPLATMVGVIVLAFIGLLICIRDRHVNLFALPLGGVLLLLILTCAIFVMFMKNGFLTALIVVITLAYISILACYKGRETLNNALQISIGLIILIIVCMIAMLFVENGFIAAIVIVMTFSFIGMIGCSRVKEKFSYAKEVAIGLLVLIVFCTLLVFIYSLWFREDNSLWNNELKYARAAAVILGRTLAEKFPDAKTLILADENYKLIDQQSALIEGLEEGFDDKVTIYAIDFPRSEKKDKETKDLPFSVSKIYTANDFNNVIKDYPDCNLIISLVGLPKQTENMDIWNLDKKERPKVALIFTAETSVTAKLKQVIAEDYLLVLTYRPGTKIKEDPCPEDPKEAFDQRYLIITKDNVEEMDTKHSHLFIKPQ